MYYGRYYSLEDADENKTIIGLKYEYSWNHHGCLWMMKIRL